MARTLKTYTTSGGFHDLAVAAPSMKAALEAWGAGSNLFQQGLAKQSRDPGVIAATMARPGVVLRRAVGGRGRFSEHAKLPTQLDLARVPKPTKHTAIKKTPPPRVPSAKASKKAEEAFEKEASRRQAQRRREDVARQRERERRDRAIAAAEAALKAAEQAHQARTGEIEKQLEAVTRKAEAEDARWERIREKLNEALRRARSAG